MSEVKNNICPKCYELINKEGECKKCMEQSNKLKPILKSKIK